MLLSKVQNTICKFRISRDIPIHVLANKLRYHLSSLIILPTHMLTGCNVTSKIGTKSSAMKNNPASFLEDFGIGEPSDAALKSVEHYLVNIIQPSLNCRTFEYIAHKIKVFQVCHQPLTCFMDTF